jgi:tetratricopeptide (TPR) repeat protein
MFDKAIIDNDKAIEIKPETAAFYFNRGLTYFNLNKFNEAVANFNKAISLGLKDAEVYSFRGESYSELGKFSEAERDFKEAALFDFLEELLWKKVVLLVEED